MPLHSARPGGKERGLRAEIEKTIADAPGPFGLAYVIDRTGASSTYARRVLDRLERAGKIQRPNPETLEWTL